MTLTGQMLIGRHAVTGTRDAIRAIDPATDKPLDPAYPGGTDELDVRVPVCHQDFPDTLLPAALKHSNPLQLRRLLDGQREAQDNV